MRDEIPYPTPRLAEHLSRTSAGESYSLHQFQLCELVLARFHRRLQRLERMRCFYLPFQTLPRPASRLEPPGAKQLEGLC